MYRAMMRGPFTDAGAPQSLCCLGTGGTGDAGYLDSVQRHSARQGGRSSGPAATECRETMEPGRRSDLRAAGDAERGQALRLPASSIMIEATGKPE